MAFISLYREWHSQTEPRGLSKLLLSQSPSCSSQLEPHVNLELEHKCFCLSRSSPGAESVPGFKIRVKNRVNVDCFRMTMVAAVRVCVVGGGYVSGRIPIILFPGGWEEFSFSHFHFCLVCIFNQGQENS